MKEKNLLALGEFFHGWKLVLKRRKTKHTFRMAQGNASVKENIAFTPKQFVNGEHGTT
ncbi:hypothetical protein [Bacillus atrophaeus]|uniref:hypothetical protein n=1 Tax=Bacillus atrophaeus TaxID=1452 RepID=UPI0030F38E7A